MKSNSHCRLNSYLDETEDYLKLRKRIITYFLIDLLIPNLQIDALELIKNENNSKIFSEI